jgi:hypothetical protein
MAALDGEIVVRYEAAHGPAEPSEGIRRLLVAVLDEGIRTLMRHAGATQVRPRRLRREALIWLLNPARSHMFCFAAICDALGIEPAWLRRQVLARLAEQESAQARGRVGRLAFSGGASACRRLA